MHYQNIHNYPDDTLDKNHYIFTGEALNSDSRSHWIEFMYNCFDTVHNSGTLRYPFPRKNLPKGKKVFPERRT